MAEGRTGGGGCTADDGVAGQGFAVRARRGVAAARDEGIGGECEIFAFSPQLYPQK